MKTIYAALPLALALSACQTLPPYGNGSYGGPPPYPLPGPVVSDYRATGTEPFWDLNIGRDLVFNDRGRNLQVVQPTPAPTHGVAGEIYQTPRINVNIVHARCSDGMSERAYPDQVQVTVDGRLYRGCGGLSDASGGAQGPGQPGSGMPGPGMPLALAQTSWTVVAINGRPVPPRDFYVNFMPDRLTAKFGCNGLGAGYSTTGNMVTAGAVIGTQMACPDMSFETQGSAVLTLPMTASEVGDRLTLSNRNGSIDLRRAR